MRLLFVLLAVIPAASRAADALTLRRPHYKCLTEVAKLPQKRVRLVSPAEGGTDFVLLHGNLGPTPGYYLVHMDGGSEANISYLDGRVTKLLARPDVRDILPGALVDALRKEVGESGSQGKATNAEAQRYAELKPVLNESVYGPVSHEVVSAVREAKVTPPECAAFPELTPEVTDAEWKVKRGAAPTLPAAEGKPKATTTGLVPAKKP